MSKKISGNVLSVQLGREETQLVLLKDGTQILHAASVATPAGAVEDGMTRNPDAIREMLKDVRKDLPVRFYSGAEDACMMGKKGFDHAMKCMRRAGCRDVQGRLFPGMRHEILNEAEKQAVFECIWQESFQPYL